MMKRVEFITGNGVISMKASSEKIFRKFSGKEGNPCLEKRKTESGSTFTWTERFWNCWTSTAKKWARPRPSPRNGYCSIIWKPTLPTERRRNWRSSNKELLLKKCNARCRKCCKWSVIKLRSKPEWGIRVLYEVNLKGNQCSYPKLRKKEGWSHE